MKRAVPLSLLAFSLAGPFCPGVVFGQGFGFRQSSPPEPRADLVKKYDQDGDGRLNDAEREGMRKARFAEKLQQQSRGGRGGFRPQLPAEIVKIYDKNKDGTLDDTEMQAAMDGIRKRWEEVNKEYDKNGNGRLDESEFDALNAAMESGKIEGVPRGMFGMRGRRGGGGGFRGGGRGGGGASDPDVRQAIIREADKDKDGRLNEDELRTAREALAKTGQRDTPKPDEGRN